MEKNFDFVVVPEKFGLLRIQVYLIPGSFMIVLRILTMLFFMLLCLEGDLMDLAENLKPVMKERMKIDIAPWKKIYTDVDMDKIYTELQIEKQEDVLTDNKIIKDYHELFAQEQKQDDTKGTKSKVNHGKKILGKGDPGMEKTTWGKKVGWDWATGIFTAYSIIFFVFLKLVRPGVAIENVIIDQTPKLEGLGIKPERLKCILEKFGHRCLLILDGLDEHALGKNEDVLKIIEGRKFLNCNIIVTSRPHSTEDMQQHFPTVVRIQGFTEYRAREFAFRLLGDTHKVETVMNFQPSRYEYIYNCPIILLIFCVLVRENQIDLKSKAFQTGELYFRLTRFLYQKYTLGKKVDFDFKNFVEVLKKLGKLAWETLKSGDLFFQRSKIIQELGEDAFDYGLIIGNEDFRLVCEEEADIVLTFVHRTIQEFLGSFYFVLMLSEGEKLENLLNMEERRTIRFMVDPLFLHFCLWFVFSNQKHLPFPNGERPLYSMSTHVLEKFDVIQLDLNIMVELFPAFLSMINDPLILDFLAKVLKDLTKTKDILLDVSHPIELIPVIMASKSKALSSLIVEDKRGLPFRNRMSPIKFAVHSSDVDFNIILRGFACKPEILEKILKHCNIYPSVYLVAYLIDYFDISQFLSEKVKKLFINANINSLECLQNISPCPNLTHLCFTNTQSMSGLVSLNIHDAMKKGNLPSLTHLSFENCGGLFLAESHLHNLLQSPWSTLTYLSLRQYRLTQDDSQALETAVKKNFLPKLETLLIPAHCIIGNPIIKRLLMNSLPNLRRLFIDDITRNDEGELLFVLKKRKLSDLIEIGLSLTQRMSNVSNLEAISKFIPQLESLTLNRFCIPLQRSPEYVFLAQLSKID